jgi:hypothetical protein
MPATPQQIATGLETRLATITGLRVYDHVPDSYGIPCAFVMPDTIEYWGGFAGGNVQQSFIVTVIVGRTSDRAAQKTLYTYTAYDGASSVRAAIEADRTLGGVAQTSIVNSAGNIRMLQQADATYLAIDFDITVHA